ncbi:MAG: ABC transporter permease, partial [Mycoplasmataceae bacterium]|nr:ABC transporter permease [Mycoplasmataceae bacterium]
GLGFLAGYNRGKLLDKVILGFVTIFIAVPSFVLAAFALVLGPALGMPVIFQDSGSTSLMIRSLIMPIIVMTLVSLAGWSQLTRNFVSEILMSDYILAARTKGFSEFTIFRKYVLRNAMYPYAGSIATSFMVIFGSSLIVEKFFNVPGTATLLLNASKNGEINVMMFNLLFFSSIGIFAQMIADIAQFMINPIVRSNFSSKIDPVTKLKYANMRRIEAKNDSRG